MRSGSVSLAACFKGEGAERARDSEEDWAGLDSRARPANGGQPNVRPGHAPTRVSS